MRRSATRDATGDATGATAGVAQDVAQESTPVASATRVEDLERELADEKERRALDAQVFQEQIDGMKALAVGREQTFEVLTAENGRLRESLRAHEEREAEAAFERGQEPRYVRRGAENMAPPKKGLGGQYTPHGANCACIACNSERAAARRAEMEPA